MNAAQEMREALQRDLAKAEEDREKQNDELIKCVRLWDEEAQRAVYIGLTWLVNVKKWIADGALKANGESILLLDKNIEFLTAVDDRLKGRPRSSGNQKDDSLWNGNGV